MVFRINVKTYSWHAKIREKFGFSIYEIELFAFFFLLQFFSLQNSKNRKQHENKTPKTDTHDMNEMHCYMRIYSFFFISRSIVCRCSCLFVSNVVISLSLCDRCARINLIHIQFVLWVSTSWTCFFCRIYTSGSIAFCSFFIFFFWSEIFFYIYSTLKLFSFVNHSTIKVIQKQKPKQKTWITSAHDNWKILHSAEKKKI